MTFWNPPALPNVETHTAVRNPLIRAPQAADLSAPVGTVMRPTLTVEAVDSLARAAGTFRENGAALLPVLGASGRLAGVLTDAGLARALGEATEPTDAVEGFLQEATTLPPYASAAEALRRGEDGRTLVVVDDGGKVVGLVSAVDLWPRRRALPRPAMVGGMATPFGVYLTTGAVSAGAPWWALMATGAAMLGMLEAGDVLAGLAVARGLPVEARPWLAAGLFFLFMRLAPLSGTHGAEHQVVNAIEREEELVPATVRRMSRVHPRCGTNLMVGLAIFGAILFAGLPEPFRRDELMMRLLPALVLAFVFARPLGAHVQRWVTTRRPTERQLAGAIRAGEALLERHATARRSGAGPVQRIWSMGLLQVIAGSFLAAFALAALRAATGWAWLPEVQ